MIDMTKGPVISAVKWRDESSVDLRQSCDISHTPNRSSRHLSKLKSVVFRGKHHAKTKMSLKETSTNLYRSSGIKSCKDVRHKRGLIRKCRKERHPHPIMPTTRRLGSHFKPSAAVKIPPGSFLELRMLRRQVIYIALRAQDL